MDDLDPVPHARHAAIVRSQLAHARVRLDAPAALAAPGVVGVLTGEDVAALSRPFPAGIESPVPFYSAAVGTARYMGEPLAVVVARDRYLAEDALELVAVDYEPLDPSWTPLAAEARPPTARSTTATSTRRSPPPTSSSARRSAFRAGAARRSSATASSPTGTRRRRADRLGELPGPFTLHTVAAAALGLPGRSCRLITPPDSGGSFGIKSSVFAYVVLMGLASRKLGVPVRWTEDRLEHLAASACATGARHGRRGRLHGTASCSRSATTRSRTSAPTCARPSRRRSTACTARSPAPTACGTSPRGTASC